MADFTLDQVLLALKNAEASGNDGDAKRLAQIADNMRQKSKPPAPIEPAPQTPDRGSRPAASDMAAPGLPLVDQTTPDLASLMAPQPKPAAGPARGTPTQPPAPSVPGMAAPQPQPQPKPATAEAGWMVDMLGGEGALVDMMTAQPAPKPQPPVASGPAGPTVMQDLQAGALQAQQIIPGLKTALAGKDVSRGLDLEANPQTGPVVQDIDRRLALLNEFVATQEDPLVQTMVAGQIAGLQQERASALQAAAAEGRRFARANAERVADSASRIMELSARISELPQNEAAKAIGEAETFREGFTAFASDPMGAIQSFTLRSLPSSAPSMVGAVVGSLVAGPGGGATLGGAGGFFTEFGSVMAQDMEGALRDAGVNVSDPAAIEAFMKANPDAFTAMIDRAAKRSGIIGAVDAVSGGVTGKIAQKVATKATPTRVGGAIATGAAVEPAFEAGGEAAAQLATDGYIQPGEVIAEAVGGAGQGAASTGGQVVSEIVRGNQPDAQTIAPRQPNNGVAPMDAPSPLARIPNTDGPQTNRLQPEQPTPALPGEAPNPIFSNRGKINQQPQPAQDPIRGTPEDAEDVPAAAPPPLPAMAAIQPGEMTEGRNVEVSIAGGPLVIGRIGRMTREGPELIEPDGDVTILPIEDIDDGETRVFPEGAGATIAKPVENTVPFTGRGTVEGGARAVEGSGARPVPQEVAPDPAPEQRPAAARKPGEPERRFLTHDETLAIETDAKTFQYKDGGDAEGVTDRLRGVTEFDPNRAGQMILYRREDGRTVVADGHQRAGLARRAAEAGQQDVGGAAATIYRESDGISPEEVMVVAAVKNIAEGSGTAVDAARILRSQGASATDLGLPPRSALVRDADGIAKLSDDAFGMVANGVASERDAAAVGRVVDDKAAHANILSLLGKLKPSTQAQAEMIARDAAADTAESGQDDLFGGGDATESLYLERAKILDAAQKDIRADRSVFARLLKDGSKIEGAGNRLDQDENAKREREGAVVLEHLQRQANTKGPISDALTAAARRLKAGESLTVARRAFVEDVKRALQGDGEAGGATGVGGPAVAGSQAPEGQGDQEAVTPQTERTPEGEQALIPGVAPVTDRDRAEAAMRKPMSGTDRGAGSGRDDLFGNPDDRRDLFDAPPEAERDPATLEREMRARMAPFVNKGDRLAANTNDIGDRAGDLLVTLDNAKTAEERHRIADDYVLEQGRKHGVEHLVMQDGDGAPMGVMAGDKGNVNPPPSFYRAALEGAKIRVTHNHPSNRGFSPADMTIMVWGDINVVAMGHDGAISRATRGPAYKPQVESMDAGDRIYAKVRNAMDAVFDALRHVMQEKIHTGEITVDAAERTHAHIFNLTLHRHGVIDFEGNSPQFIEKDGIDVDSLYRITDAAIRRHLGRAGFDVSEVRSSTRGPADQGRGGEERAASDGQAVSGADGAPSSGRDGDGRIPAVDEARQLDTAPSSIKRQAGGSVTANSGLDETAFHGSPHQFDRFSTDFMGSGEGAQAYGWGLYFASKRGVGEHYREKLSQRRYSEFAAEFEARHPVAYEYLSDDLANVTPSFVGVTPDLAGIEIANFLTSNRQPRWMNDSTAEALSATGANPPSAGRLYTVEVPDASDLMAWDAPLTEQPEKVRDIILGKGGIVEEMRQDESLMDFLDPHINDDFEGLTGREFYQLIQRLFESDYLPINGPGVLAALEEGRMDKAASMFLYNEGIPGHRFLDGASRSKGEGSFNFVIYDDADVQMIAAEQRPAPGRTVADPAVIARAMPRLRAELDRLNLKRVTLELDAPGMGRQGAMVARAPGEIDILIGQSIDPDATLYHEAIHAMRAMNLFTPEEWTALETAAAKRGPGGAPSWIEKHRIADRYPDLMQDERIEEAIAEEFAERFASRKSPAGSILIRAFNKIARLLKALRNAITGPGVQTAEDVFGAVMAGQIGARDAGNTGAIAARDQRRSPSQDRILDLLGTASGGLTGDQIAERAGISRSSVKVLVSRLGDAVATGYIVSGEGDGLTKSEQAVVDRLKENPRQTAGDLADLLGFTQSSVRTMMAGARKKGVRIEWAYFIGEQMDGSAGRLLGREGRPLQASNARRDPRADEQVAARPDTVKEQAPPSFAPPDPAPDDKSRDGMGFSNSTIAKHAELSARYGHSGPPRQEAFPPVWGAPKRTGLRKMHEFFADRFIMFRAMEWAIEKQTGQAIPESMSFSLKETLFKGRVADRLERLMAEEVRPIQDAIGRSKVSLDDLGMYLIARHAPERNALMAKRDPKLFGKGGGSGMTDAMAAEVMDGILKKHSKATMDRLAKMIETVLRRDLKLRRAAGLISEEQYKAYTTMFEHYVPLRGFAEREEGGQLGTGRGFDIRGKESRSALGRFTLADNPVVQAFAMRQSGIVRAEKNRVMRALMRLVQKYPHPSVWEFMGKLPMRRMLDPETGMVKEVVDFGATREDDVVAVKIDGDTKYLRVKDPLMQAAVKNLENVDVGVVMKILMGIRRMTTAFSRLQTGANPDFVVPNGASDFLEGVWTAANVKDKKKMAVDYALSYRIALWQGVKAEFGDSMIGRKLTGESRKRLQKLLGEGVDVDAAMSENDAYRKEWEASGGKINFMAFRDLDEIQRNLEREIQRNGRRLWQIKPWEVVEDALQVIEKINAPVESAGRLAMYIAARKNGLSKERAAEMALDASGNYYRQGRATKGFAALYAFFNPAVQGIEKFMRFSKRPMNWAIMGGLATTGYLLTRTYIEAYQDDDDPEKRSLYLEIPEYERARSIIIPGEVEEVDTGVKDENGDPIMTKRLTYRAIRIPHNLRPILIMGNKLAEIQAGQTDPDTAAQQVGEGFLMNTNPMGDATPGNFLTPTIFDPFVDVGLNRNFFDSPIRPESYPNEEGLPASYKYFERSTNPAFPAISQALNAASGGDKYNPGWADSYPDDIEYFWDFVTGGLGRFISRGIETGRNMAAGVESDPNRIPVLRSFSGRTTEYAEGRLYYAMREDIKHKKNRLVAASKDMKEDPTDVLARETFESLMVELNAAIHPKSGKFDWRQSTWKIIDEADGFMSGARQDILAAMRDDTLGHAERQKRIRALRVQIEGAQIKAREDVLRLLREVGTASGLP